jgi:hypothetical protein
MQRDSKFPNISYLFPQTERTFKLLSFPQLRVDTPSPERGRVQNGISLALLLRKAKFVNPLSVYGDDLIFVYKIIMLDMYMYIIQCFGRRICSHLHFKKGNDPTQGKSVRSSLSPSPCWKPMHLPKRHKGKAVSVTGRGGP